MRTNWTYKARSGVPTNRKWNIKKRDKGHQENNTKDVALLVGYYYVNSREHFVIYYKMKYSIWTNTTILKLCLTGLACTRDN